MPKSRARVVSPSVVLVKPVQKKKKNTAKKSMKEMSLSPFLSLHADPFNGETQMAGRPDFNALPTVVWRETIVYTASTNADGRLWYQFRPWLSAPEVRTTLTGGTSTSGGLTTAVAVPNYTELLGMFSTWRALTCALSAEYVGEAQLAKGVIGVCRSNTYPATGESMPQWTDESGYKEGPLASEKVAAVLHLHENGFQAMANGLDTEYLHLMVDGAPASSPCIRVKFTITFEATVGGSKLLSRDAVHTVSHPPQLAVAASIVGDAASVAVGLDPEAQIVKHTKKLINGAAKVNGLIRTAKPLLAELAEFASLIL